MLCNAFIVSWYKCKTHYLYCNLPTKYPKVVFNSYVTYQSLLERFPWNYSYMKLPKKHLLKLRAKELTPSLVYKQDMPDHSLSWLRWSRSLVTNVTSNPCLQMFVQGAALLRCYSSSSLVSTYTIVDLKGNDPKVLFIDWMHWGFLQYCQDMLD